MDADRKNDPTYPMKKRTDAEQTGYSWDRPAQQPVTEEVLRSIERPNISAVHGTSAPPSGLSGAIRRAAFKQSESSYGRWLPLILADRVNVVEGVLDDLIHGHFPNFFKEKGFGARWKYDRQNAMISLATTVVITAAVVGLFIRRRGRR